MAIKWTGYDRIELNNRTAISVNSETPGSTSAHSKIVDAIIKAVAQIENSDKGADGESDQMHATDVAIKTTDGEDDPIPTLVGADAPAEENCSEGGPMPGVRTTDGDPKPEVPAGNPPAPLGESVPAKPKLMISIAKDTWRRHLKAISIIFENLYEVFDRDEERAMAFVECIASTELKGMSAVSIDNGREVAVSESCYLGVDGYDELIKRAMQPIQWATTLAVIDYEITVRDDH